MNQERPPKARKGERETLFPDFYGFEEPTLEGVEKLEKELFEYPEFKPRLTFPFPLDKERIRAIEMIKTEKPNEKDIIGLLKSGDFVKRIAGEHLLKKIKGISKEGVAELQSILENKEWREKNGALSAKVKVKIILEMEGQNALNTLIEMCESRYPEIQIAAVEGLGELGDEKALPVLNYYVNPSISEAVSNARVKIILKNKAGKEAVEALKKSVIFTVPEREARAIILDAVKKEGEKAMPWLKDLCNDKIPHIRRPAAKALARLVIKNKDKKYTPESLKGFFRAEGIPYDKEIKEAAEFEINKHRWLIAHQKSLFATPYTKELIDAITDFQKISKQLKERVGNKFIGFNILGSASKGNFAKKDIDFAIIAEEDLTKEFVKFPNYEVVDEITVEKNNMLTNQRFPRNLFRGIFIGDFNRLNKIQKNFLENIDEEELVWDETRKSIIEQELYNSNKLAERFGLTQEEAERVKIITMLTRIPPPYEEARKIIDKRYKRLKDIKKR